MSDLARSRGAAGALLALWLAGTAASGAEVEAFPVDEVRAGLRGYGESVFAGTAPERFEVEVLGVLRDTAPGTDYVLARLTGRDLERLGVVAGMSGSPVWIDGRLLGAVAFAWPFATEAIAGITPIGAMREIGLAAPWAGAPGRSTVTLEALAGHSLPADLLSAAAAELVRSAGLEARGAVAWVASGFSPAALDRLGRALPALSPVAGGRSEEPAGELAPGSSVAAVFVDGDLRLAATGTVTDRDGDRLLAFGHSVAGLGEISLPMAPAEVVTVLPSRYASFKLANSGPVVGEFVRDHPAGTLGRVGVVPPTLPMAVRVEAPTAREYSLRLARVPRLLPLLAAIGAIGAIDSAVSAGGVEGLDLEISAQLGSHGALELGESFEGGTAVGEAAGYLFAVLDFLVRTDLARVEIDSLEVSVRPWAHPRGTALVGAHAVRSRLEPGETAELYVDLRAWRGEVERRRLEIPIPADLPAGRYTLLVGDGASADAARLALEPAVPVTFEQALELLRSLGSSREIAVLGVLTGEGLALSGEVLPRLPGSLRSIWAAGGGGGARPLRLAIVQRERFEETRPVSGLVRIDVEIRRPQPATAGG
ncbi:MAG TPA: hypothetical protein VLA66_10820, partial [Thermoanaerobaculia bacterium]|nr:hypothetical protein [Thermoanaerobaculia bacterium]